MPWVQSSVLYADKADPACRICGAGGLSHMDVREMMFGLRERFHYDQCHACGCLQIVKYLDNIEKHYPDNYYSFVADGPGRFYYDRSTVKIIKHRLKELAINFSDRTRSWFLNSEATRRWLKSRPVVNRYLTYVTDPKVRILDVGCGGGNLLEELFYLYYENILGCDPFIPNDIYYNGKVLIRKAWMRDLSPAYDCISLHHVLEHMPDQLSVMQEARALLAPNGIIMIRIPVVGGTAWQTYREDWVQLDAPRHYYLHSEQSFLLLVDQAGLEVELIEYDSTGFQFWGSEMYRRDIPLTDLCGPGRSITSVFSASELADYEARAKDLNQRRDGDQLVAILRKKGNSSR
jgi:SAM-dependent methyltransferase